MNRKQTFKSELTEMKPYWDSVRDSLAAFHAYSSEQADAAVTKYLQDILDVMTDPSLLYHDEPFYLANDIANLEIPLSKHRSAYNAILRKCGLTLFEVVPN